LAGILLVNVTNPLSTEVHAPSYVNERSCICGLGVSIIVFKKSLKIPKGSLEDVSQRKKDNTTQKIKGQTMMHKTLYGKLKIEQHEFY